MWSMITHFPYIHQRDVCRRCADVPFADGKAGGRRI